MKHAYELKIDGKPHLVFSAGSKAGAWNYVAHHIKDFLSNPKLESMNKIELRRITTREERN